MAIFLHIGFPKTATTSLQIAFQDRVEDLKQAGVCYPLIDQDFKQRYLKNFGLKSLPSGKGLPKSVQKNMDDMKKLIKASGCADVVLSCEELTNFMMMTYDTTSAKALRDQLREIDDDIRLVAYVRNPSDFYLSILQEKLKRSGGVLEPQTFQANFAKTIRYYEDVFEVKAIVREFHSSKLKDKDIVADFLHATGLEHVDISSWTPIRSNESVSAEALFALDLARRDYMGSELVYEFRESEMLWRKSNMIANESEIYQKPVLFKHIHDQVMFANQSDIDVLHERYGISFSEGNYVEGQPTFPPESQLSLVEDLMHVDRSKAIFIWSTFTLRAIREVFQLREKVRRLRAEQA
ncbi:hypothetical protein NNA36_16010 [Shimia sp. CNT1-13L.2]|uniref:hypothetical protein n=1 Tax=Shimia sp. CNT1-13L.2 TaxID=2959663 RepID=UPI0020CBF312|nr:hypothetical protein [Shimia sp. CNT1-13L.2]MCP9483470.1 hypothetical protein [Shimia sp. CNT1-13L.2]